MRSVTPRCHSRRVAEQGPQRERRRMLGAHGRQSSLRTLQGFQGGQPWAWQTSDHLEGKAFSFSLLPHQHWLDTEPRPAPWENETMNHRKYSPRDSFCWHRDISWRSTLYQALPINCLISPWQWPHVAEGSERLHNLLKISALARSRVKSESGSIRD